MAPICVELILALGGIFQRKTNTFGRTATGLHLGLDVFADEPEISLCSHEEYLLMRHRTSISCIHSYLTN